MRSIRFLRVIGLSVVALVAVFVVSRSTGNPVPAVTKAPAVTTETAPEMAQPEPIKPAPVAIAAPGAPVKRPARSVAKPAPSAAGFAPAQGGMMVAIDPETGQFSMPTPEQRAELFGDVNMEENYRSDDLVQVKGPGRTWGMDLRGRFLEFSMARVGADGKVQFDCTTDPSLWLAEHAKNQPAAPTTPTTLEEK